MRIGHHLVYPWSTAAAERRCLNYKKTWNLSENWGSGFTYLGRNCVGVPTPHCSYPLGAAVNTTTKSWSFARVGVLVRRPLLKYPGGLLAVATHVFAAAAGAVVATCYVISGQETNDAGRPKPFPN
jgi:hypothetical protein